MTSLRISTVVLFVAASSVVLGSDASAGRVTDIQSLDRMIQLDDWRTPPQDTDTDSDDEDEPTVTRDVPAELMDVIEDTIDKYEDCRGDAGCLEVEVADASDLQHEDVSASTDDDGFSVEIKLREQWGETGPILDPAQVGLADLSIMSSWSETAELCGTAEIALSGNLACHLDDDRDVPFWTEADVSVRCAREWAGDNWTCDVELELEAEWDSLGDETTIDWGAGVSTTYTDPGNDWEFSGDFRQDGDSYTVELGFVWGR